MCDKTLRYLGQAVDRAAHDDLHTRMILLGKDWSIDRLAALTGMRLGGDERICRRSGAPGKNKACGSRFPRPTIRRKKKPAPGGRPERAFGVSRAARGAQRLPGS